MKLNRLSLNVVGLNRIGLNRIGSPSRGSSSGSDRPYIDPEVLASLKAVCICYGKSNDDPDRAVVKNLVDPDNPFVISNAAYEGMSGYNGYPIILSGTNSTYQDKASYTNIVGDDKNIINITRTSFNTAAIFSYIKQNGTLTDYNRNIESFKVKVTGIDYSKFVIKYSYISGTNATERTVISITSDGTYELPKSFASDGSLTSDNVWIGLNFTKQSTDIPDIIEDVNVTIEVLPEFEGAFVTDGIDDLITSTKTVQEMLGGSNEITVVSMIHQIDGNVNYTNGYTNYIRHGGGFIRNSVTGINGKGFNKTGIYGYTSTQLDSSNMGLGNVINNILGDKDDYSFERSLTYTLDDAKYSVQNFVNANNQPSNEGSSVAWYWTIIANKVLTTDQINQVIAYFNLDRTLKPDILCNTIKQGITNENHAEFGDKLIDFSGNGRDIQLNNLAWDGDSGIGKYNYPNWKVTATIANTYSTIVNYPTVNGTYSINVNGVSELMQSIGLHLEIKYTTSTGIIYKDIKQDGVYSYILPDGATDLTLRFGGIPGIVNEPCNITITQIPSHAGALCLDGVNDFGKVTGMPIYKDYIFIADRQIITNDDSGGIVASKSESSTDVAKQGAFIFEYLSTNAISTWSYYKNNSLVANSDSNRNISYQSKYSYNGKALEIGEGKDSDKLWIGTIRDNDERFANIAIYSLMSFPYSMSEFLIERQLKKHKLGTLYPDMVEFRPIVKSNLPYSSISYSVNPGEYISVDSMVTITVTLPNTSDKLMEVSCNAISDISISGDNGVYEITGKVVKSPQKINLVISSYLTMLSNSTLISNETLIKNE